MQKKLMLSLFALVIIAPAYAMNNEIADTKANNVLLKHLRRYSSDGRLTYFGEYTLAKVGNEETHAKKVLAKLKEDKKQDNKENKNPAKNATQAAGKSA